jgi:hypothetical protein
MSDSTTSKNNEGLVIVKGSYGIEGNFVDVTKELQGLVKDGDIDITVSSQTLGILDPAPGVTKTLQIQHTINGGHKNLDLVEDGKQFKLSVPNVNKQKNHRYNAFSYFFQALFIGLILFLAIECLHAGKLIFGQSIGWLFFGLTLITFGHFSHILLFILLFAGWLMSSNYEFPKLE